MAGALSVLEYNLVGYRTTWRSSVFSSFVSPLFFLAAMGVGLGGLVQQRTGTVGGVDYLSFLAPGLLAATAMQAATVESTYPIMAKVKWLRIYEGVLATPVGVADIVVGELAFIAVRLLMVACVNLVVMMLFGVPRTPLALLAIPAAMLTGLAFAAPIMAFSATQSDDVGFSALNRFIVLPLFLLGGAFFPLSQLPVVLQGAALVFPLSHGVALTRDAVLGDLSLAAAATHVAVLVAFIGVGAPLARRLLERRLVV